MELNRQTKAMEIEAGEIPCYLILFCISLKKETHWMSNSVGKVSNKLSLFKELAHEGSISLS